MACPCARLSLRFRAPARYDDELVVRTRLERVGGASVDFQYEVRSHADALLAEGSSELACVDLASPERRPRFLPDDVRAGFERAIRA